ncbi:phage tail protein [Veronia pacifica]|uniref:Phage tail protein n=1 Tax=Veronia pacifica TaxID=1080227 RepID=A0A1C3EE57_9GAMM|nr:phage tail protein [Veronia pacifica]ODA31515.1 hypothetical protein A8L45_16590 [Veronia pacifica]
MKKLESLREYLLSSPLSIEPDDLLTFAEQGQVISYRGEQNNHFELSYLANIIITDFAGRAEEVAYLTLEWMKLNQPTYDQEALEFEVDILSQSAVDLSLRLKLSEVVKVDIKADGIHLKSCVGPDLTEILIPNQEQAANE